MVYVSIFRIPDCEYFEMCRKYLDNLEGISSSKCVDECSSDNVMHSLVPRLLPCTVSMRVTLKTWEWPGDVARSCTHSIVEDLR
jgi:hypothetical protein